MKLNPLILTIGICLFSKAYAVSFDPFGIDAASVQLHSSVDDLNKGLDAVPVELQKTIGSNITLLNADVKQMLSCVDDKTIPLLNHTAAAQMNHLSDLTTALTRHINHLAQKDIRSVDKDVTKRIAQIQQVATTELENLNNSVKDAMNLAKDSAIYLEDHAGAVTIKVIDRTLQEVIRLVGFFLFLIGALLLSLQLIGKNHETWSVKKTFAAMILLAIYFATTLFVAIKPVELAKLAPKSQTTSRATPCVSLKLQQKHLELVESLGDQALLQVTQQRIADSRKNCLK